MPHRIKERIFGNESIERRGLKEKENTSEHKSIEEKKCHEKKTKLALQESRKKMFM
jgi:hypothetical protein